MLEHLLYASLLEDAPADLADEGMAKCEQDFFDWNEVRVTTVTELSQVLSRLPDPLKAARRLKSNLQAIFEEFYTFDLDHLKKENLGKAVNKFEKMPGMTPFVLSYTIQHGLGGHSIPVDYSAMVIMLSTEIATQPEAMSGKVPGLERAIPKSKGIEFAGLLHQAAVALEQDDEGQNGSHLARFRQQRIEQATRPVACQQESGQETRREAQGRRESCCRGRRASRRRGSQESGQEKEKEDQGNEQAPRAREATAHAKPANAATAKKSTKKTAEREKTRVRTNQTGDQENHIQEVSAENGVGAKSRRSKKKPATKKKATTPPRSSKEIIQSKTHQT